MARVFLKSKTILFLTLIVLPLHFLKASPCCGQNASDLGVMTLRQKANVYLGQMYGTALGRVYGHSNDFFVWPEEKHRTTHITQLKLSYEIKNRLQFFSNIAYQVGEFKGSGLSQSASQMMDSSVGLTYEFISEYKFSYYKPTVYVSLFSNLPTGKSVFTDNVGTENIGVTGHGQWGAGVGLTLNKVILPWSLMVQLKTLRLFPDSFQNTSVKGFFDSSFQILLGYALPIWNVNINLGMTQLELSERKIQSKEQVLVPNARSTMMTIGFTKPIHENFILSFNYGDQSLIGRPKNTLLSQTFSLGLTYNYF